MWVYESTSHSFRSTRQSAERVLLFVAALTFVEPTRCRDTESRDRLSADVFSTVKESKYLESLLQLCVLLLASSKLSPQILYSQQTDQKASNVARHCGLV